MCDRDIRISQRKGRKAMKISDEIVKQQFVQREYGLAHSTYDNELDFYQLVSSGDVKAVSGMLQTGEEDEALLQGAYCQMIRSAIRDIMR